MKYGISIVFGVLSYAASVSWSTETVALGQAISDTFHDAYVAHFFDKATFLVNCL